MSIKTSETLRSTSLRKHKTSLINKDRETMVRLVHLKELFISFNISAVNMTDDVTTPLRQDEEETSSVDGNHFLMDEMNSDNRFHEL